MPKRRCKSLQILGKVWPYFFLDLEKSHFLIFCVPRMLVLLSYLVSNLIFEFCLRLIQCKFLIDLESIPI